MSICITRNGQKQLPKQTYKKPPALRNLKQILHEVLPQLLGAVGSAATLPTSPASCASHVESSMFLLLTQISFRDAPLISSAVSARKPHFCSVNQASLYVKFEYFSVETLNWEDSNDILKI